MKELEAIRDFARELSEHSDMHIHSEDLMVKAAAAVEGICADRIKALLPALDTALREKSADKATVLTMRMLRTELDRTRAEVAALREPMSCTHPRACWKERDSKLSKGPMGTEYREGYCTACEHKRLAVAAALREATSVFREAYRIEMLDSHDREMATGQGLRALDALDTDADRRALDAHDADTRNRALEEAATTAKQYGLGHEGDSIAAAIRTLKREK